MEDQSLQKETLWSKGLILLKIKMTPVMVFTAHMSPFCIVIVLILQVQPSAQWLLDLWLLQVDIPGQGVGCYDCKWIITSNELSLLIWQYLCIKQWLHVPCYLLVTGNVQRTENKQRGFQCAQFGFSAQVLCTCVLCAWPLFELYASILRLGGDFSLQTSWMWKM